MKISWLEFWVGAIACFRLTVLITRCIGPWQIFQRLRKIDRCSKLLKCPLCVSVYMGWFTSFLLWLGGIEMPLSMWFLISLAFSGITIALDRTFTSDITN